MFHSSRRLAFARNSYRRNTNTLRLIICGLVAMTGGLVFLRAVSASNITWDGGGTTNNWSEAANWSGDVVPGANDVAIFDGTSTKNATIDSGGPQGANITIQAIRIATGFSGTITQAPGVNLKLTSVSSFLSCGSTTVSFLSFCQEAGTFSGSNSTIDFDGTFKLVGGVFNASSGTTFFGSDFTHTDGGSFNHNGGLAVFDGTSGTMSVNPPDTFNNLTSARISNNFLEGKVIVSGTLTLDEGFLVSLGAGGVVEAQGAVALNSGFDGGNCLLLITAGTGTPRTITFDAGRKMLPTTLNASNVSINTAGTGTLAWRNLTFQAGTIDQGGVAFDFGAVGQFTGAYDQGGGTFNGSSQPITFGINGGQFNQTGGSFNGSSGNITALNVFQLSGGSFTASSNTTAFHSNFTHTAGGTFITNGGTVAFEGSGGTIAVTQETFNHVTFNKTNDFDNAFMFLDGTIIATGTLLLNEGTFSALSNAKIEARGNVTINSTFNGGNVPLAFTGSNNQIFTNNGGPNLTGTWTINKASGQVTLASNLILINNQTLTITSGALDQGPSFNLQTAGLLTIGAAGTLRNFGTGDLTLGSDLVNNGTLNLNGGGSGCNDPNVANPLQVNSTNATVRTWSGSDTGIFSLVDADVDRQAVGTPPTSITAFAASHLTNTTGFLLDAGCPLTITSQPTNQGGCAGGPVSFTVGASGSGLTFQWRKNSVNLVNGGNISNATTPTLTINPTAAGDVGSYDAVVTSNLGITVTSNAATLSLLAAPQVTQSPTNATRCPGQSVTFTASATGDGLTFQWRKNGQEIVGATESSLTIDPVSAGDAGSYDVVVGGTCSPSVTSAAATLTVNTPPAINTQPTNQTACENGDASFNVSASGTGLTFQWRKNGTPLVNSSHITGADTATLTIHQVVQSDADTYDVVVSGACSPAVTSVSRTLTVTSSMNISTQPNNTSACEGALASFTAASSDATASVQWQVSTNGGGTFNNIPGATATTLSFTASAIQNGNQFRAVFTNSCSTATTSAATLTVNSSPSITNQPVNQTVCEGALASFSVEGTGSAQMSVGKRRIKRPSHIAVISGLSFQWRKNGTPLTNDGHFSGVDTPTLSIFPAVAADAGSYDVIVSGSCSPPATSNAASLTVNGFALSAPSQTVPLSGGNGSVDVITDASCQWTAASNDSFIHVTSGSPGTGNGTVNFSVDASAGPRTGTLTIAGLTFTVNQEGGQALAPVIISEFRFRGSAGPLDEFIELYNNSDSPADISGYSLQALTADAERTLVFTVPGALDSNTTVIPPRGHYLIANTSGSGFSLASVASPDGSYTADIVDGSGIGLFGGSVPADNNRVDSVGFDSRDTLFFEGTLLTPTGGITTDGEHSFVRQFLTTGGLPQDTNNNASDFVFVSTTGGVFNGRQSMLGAPGPENLSSPILRNTSIAVSLIDPSVASSSLPNRERDLASDPANNSTFGTLTIRRRFTNNTGQPASSLRFRIMNITTFPSPGGGIADVRARSSADTSVTITGGANVTVRGTTLDAPAQPMGGGYNSTLSAGTITLGTPLAAGASIDVQFLLGVQATGTFRFFVNIEAVASAVPPP